MVSLPLNTSNKIEPDFQLEKLIQALSVESSANALSPFANPETQLKTARLPLKKDEDWQFTDLTEFKQLTFAPPQAATVSEQQAATFYLLEAPQSRLVFVNGKFSADLSDTSGLPAGIICASWQNLTAEQQQQLSHHFPDDATEQDVFSLLNTYGCQDLAVINVPDNTVVETPIHCLFLSVVDPTPAWIQPRLLVVAGANSQLTLAENYGAVAETRTDRPQQQPYCNNGVTDVVLGENAKVVHIRNQRDSGDSYHFAASHITQARYSHYQLVDIQLGAKLSRHTPHVVQQGEQTQTELFALTAIAGRQVSDTHSTIALQHPHGTTNQQHKCIVDEFAQAVFSGKVLVPQAAQLTNAQQLNRNLLLSNKARVNTKPELQITADNVKCSHGATISQLEADELFYLRSRGLNDTDARYLLIDAFAGEILDKIPLPSLQQRLQQCIACRTI